MVVKNTKPITTDKNFAKRDTSYASLWLYNKLSDLNSVDLKDKFVNFYDEKELMSEFNPNIAKNIISFWSNRKDLILDPFAGRTRALVAFAMDRRYIGYDISKDTYQYIINRFDELKLFDNPNFMVDIRNQDCLTIKDDFKEECFDLVFSCYDDKTEVLTRNGFKLLKELTLNDEVATLNLNEELEYQKPFKLHNYLHKGKMFHLKSGVIDLLVTPEHNLYIKKSYQKTFSLVETTKAFKNLNEVWEFKKNGKWNGVYKEKFILPEYNYLNQNHKYKKEKMEIDMNLFLEFLGYYISEGCCEKNYVTLFQNENSSTFKKMIDVIKKIGWHFDITKRKNRNNETKPKHCRIRIGNTQLSNYLQKFGKQKERNLKEFLNLSSEQLNILFNALMVGDGRIVNGKNVLYFTSSKELADDIMELLLKIGKCGNLNIGKKSVCCIRGKSYLSNEKYTISINHSCLTPIFNAQKRQVKIEEYDGNVYCCSVPNQVIYVRRNGKCVWCGNCPPYWNLEKYQSCEGQLSDIKEYGVFLEELRKRLDISVSFLKKGGYMCLVVGDFRKNGCYVTFHADLIGAMRSNPNITLHDVIVIQNIPFVTSAFYFGSKKKFKYTAKTHEYLLVWKKNEM